MFTCVKIIYKYLLSGFSISFLTTYQWQSDSIRVYGDQSQSELMTARVSQSLHVSMSCKCYLVVSSLISLGFQRTAIIQIALFP